MVKSGSRSIAPGSLGHRVGRGEDACHGGEQREPARADRRLPIPAQVVGGQKMDAVRLDRSSDDRALGQAKRKVGQLTMENEILRAAAEKRGLQIPPAKRPR